MKKNKKLNPWISTVSIDSICYTEDSMEQRLQRIDDYIATIADQPDLILLPEACLTGLAALEERYRFISPQDKYFSHFQQLAKQYNTHIAATVLFSDDGKYYNAVLLFNPKGELDYIYYKSYLTTSELDAGLTPGNPLQKCWTAPWGKTAFAICYDINFQPLFDNYQQQRIELLLFPSYLPGGMVLQQRALFLRSFVVSSHGQGFESLFIDRVGRQFLSSNMLEPVVTSKLMLNSAAIRYEPEKFKIIKAEFGRQVLFELLRPEGFALIVIPELQQDVKDIISKYKLSLIDDWYNSCEIANNRQRKN
jgi:hypothetical protein